MWNLSNDELITQLIDKAMPDEDYALRGEAARRLMVCEDILKAIDKELWNENFTTEHTAVKLIDCLRKMLNPVK